MDQELTYKWIQERLRELHSGTLSEQDRLRLVEIAQHDPFVSDALEGFHAHPDIEHTEHLEELKQKIRHTKRERRRWLIPNLTVTAVAASVLLIVATYIVITRIEKPVEENVFVMVAPDTLTIDDTASTAAKELYMRMPGEGDQEAYTAAGSSEKEVTGQADVKGATKKQDPFKPAATTDKTPDVTSAAPSATAETFEPLTPPPTFNPEDDEPPVEEGMPMQSKVELSRAKRDEGYYANQMNPALMQSRVIGHVADAHSGVPIMSAKLAVDYSNQLFYTDIEGGFELYIPQPEAVLQVTYPGYADTVLIIKPTEENILVDMKPGSILSSNVIAGTQRKGPVPSGTLNPVSSFHHFYNYISAASSLQLTSEASSARRKVTLEFTVKSDGRPRDINVLETSRDKTYDNEAKRLLESGPDWVCQGGGYPCLRSYTFYFR